MGGGGPLWMANSGTDSEADPGALSNTEAKRHRSFDSPWEISSWRACSDRSLEADAEGVPAAPAAGAFALAAGAPNQCKPQMGARTVRLAPSSSVYGLLVSGSGHALSDGRSRSWLQSAMSQGLPYTF